MAISLNNIAPRTPPVSHTSWRLWLRQNLFANRTSTVTSVSLLLLGLWLLPQLWSWAVWHAQFRPDADACQSIRGIGACAKLSRRPWPVGATPISRALSRSCI